MLVDHPPPIVARGSPTRQPSLPGSRPTRARSPWTLVSRITGFGRVAAIAAVLGPTYFGNLFQTANAFPHVVHELLVGSLITGLLVPPIVRHVDARDPAAAKRLANGFLGVAALAGAATALLCLAAVPLLLFLMTAAVDVPDVRQRQSELGAPLVALVLRGSSCTASSRRVWPSERSPPLRLARRRARRGKPRHHGCHGRLGTAVRRGAGRASGERAPDLLSFSAAARRLRWPCTRRPSGTAPIASGCLWRRGPVGGTRKFERSSGLLCRRVATPP